jgi:hypothetical protein
VEDAAGIRKQITELAIADLQRYPIWEFAIDEEGEPGQDEETVKPRPDLRRADPDGGIFVVRSRFVARDGTRFDGFVTASGDADLGSVQPTVITPAGHVYFWFGIREPSARTIEDSYRKLQTPRDHLFPLAYESDLDAGAATKGEISGFYYYADAATEKVARKS